jgi:hypothetical protein
MTNNYVFLEQEEIKYGFDKSNPYKEKHNLGLMNQAPTRI